MAELSFIRKRHPFISTRHISVNLLKDKDISGFENIEPEPTNTLNATDENADTFMSEVSNVVGSVGDLMWEHYWGISPPFIAKLKYKVGLRNAEAGKSIDVDFDLTGIGPQKVITSTQTTEQIFEEEVPINQHADGVHIHLATNSPNDKVYIKVYEIQLLA
jgi:hypothetical protein